jgi:MFS family permease
MLVYSFVLLAMAGIVAFTSRAARERGRSGVRWGALSIVAGVVGVVIGAIIFGWAASGSATSTSASGFLFATVVAIPLAPLACMLAALGLLMGIPERVPELRGHRWPVHRMSTREHPGGDCTLSIEKGRLLLGTETIELTQLTDIATDGECLQLTWAGKTVLLLPAAKGQTSRIRAKQSLALEKRLRSLRG